MIRYIRQSMLFLLAMTLLTGILYPLSVTGIAQVLFPWQANGSMIAQKGNIVGSERIGQMFISERYFHGRPSAAGTGYDALASAGSNLGPTNPAFLERTRTEAARVRTQEGLKPDAQLPPDMVLASASGLDPHISIESAMLQVPRIARSRDIPENQLFKLVDRLSEFKTYGIPEQPKINVLKLNLALDGLQQ